MSQKLLRNKFSLLQISFFVDRLWWSVISNISTQPSELGEREHSADYAFSLFQLNRKLGYHDTFRSNKKKRKFSSFLPNNYLGYRNTQYCLLFVKYIRFLYLKYFLIHIRILVDIWSRAGFTGVNGMKR